MTVDAFHDRDDLIARVKKREGFHKGQSYFFVNPGGTSLGALPRAVNVRVYLHEISHVVPPTATCRRLRNSIPAGFILNLGVGKQLPGFRVEGDRVVVYAMRTKHILEFLPDRTMPLPILIFGTAIQLHDKTFSDHVLLIHGGSTPRRCQTASITIPS